MLTQPSNFVQKGRLKEIEGDLSIPESAGIRYIVVLVSDDKKNTDGGTVFKKWAQAENNYKKWFSDSYGKMSEFLGQIRTTQVQSDTVVACLLCKKGEEIKYDALEKCIDALGAEVANNSGTVHMSKIEGWDKVEKVVQEKLLKRGILVNVYVKNS